MSLSRSAASLGHRTDLQNVGSAVLVVRRQTETRAEEVENRWRLRDDLVADAKERRRKVAIWRTDQPQASASTCPRYLAQKRTSERVSCLSPGFAHLRVGRAMRRVDVVGASVFEGEADGLGAALARQRREVDQRTGMPAWYSSS